MAAQAPIPVYTQLNDLYNNLGTTVDHATRWNNLAEEFEKRFGRKPAYIARAPGRVKYVSFTKRIASVLTIGQPHRCVSSDRHDHSELTVNSGEHIDYCLFGVLPAAVERDILIAIAPRAHDVPGHTVADNLLPKYTRAAFAPSHKEPSDSAVHAEPWHLEINPAELRWESYVKAGYYVRATTNYSGYRADE